LRSYCHLSRKNQRDLALIKTLLVLASFILAGIATAQTTVYVNPSTGDDTNAGTIGSPFRTISHGLSVIGSGGIVYLRGGTYSYTGTIAQANYISMNTTATAANPIRLWASPGEKPVLDFAGDSVGQGILMGTRASHYYLKGLEIKNAMSLGIDIYATCSIFENCSFHGCGQNGLGWPPGGVNTNFSCDSLAFINCDSYHNQDLPGGENANGWVLRGNHVTLRGCRAFENCDDGFDLYYSTHSVTFDSCYSYRNGAGLTGNGMGWKLGGSAWSNQNDSSQAWHHLHNCVAFDNIYTGAGGGGGMGYDRNRNPRGQTMYNCTGFRNSSTHGQVNFNMGACVSPDTIINCVNYPASYAFAFGTGTNALTNSWQIKTVTSADFLSLDTTGIGTWGRDANGYLTAMPNSFLQLAPTSTLINAGTNIGLPYVGSAPDVGAFEYAPSTPPTGSSGKRFPVRYK
jgi:hypothetical protein